MQDKPNQFSTIFFKGLQPATFAIVGAKLKHDETCLRILLAGPILLCEFVQVAAPQ